MLRAFIVLPTKGRGATTLAGNHRSKCLSSYNNRGSNGLLSSAATRNSVIARLQQQHRQQQQQQNNALATILTTPAKKSLTISSAMSNNKCLLRRWPSAKKQQYHRHQGIMNQQQFLLHQNLGSITYFSSLGGGGGRRNPFLNSSRISQGVGLASAAAVLFGKGKYLLGALKLTKFASLGSMILSIGAYTTIFGFPYACGMVGLMLVHETGHALVMLQRGIPTSPMVFIPFVGAVIAMKKRPKDAWENALVAFGGPVLGSMGAGAVAITASMTESQLLYALADFGYMVNLFNLLPIGSLDGGQITDALSPYAGVLGLGIGGSLVYSGAVTHPIMYLVLLTGGYQTFQRFYYPHHVPPNYYRISNGQRAALTGGYFGLIAAIFAGIAANQRYQKPPEVIQRERMRELSWDMR